MGWHRRSWLIGGIVIAAMCQIAAIAAADSADGPAVAAARVVRTKSRPSGAIVLTVNVYEPGQLTVVGLYGPGAPRAGVATASAPRPLPKVFGAAQENATAPTTIRLRLRPSAAARRMLRRRHHLRVYITVVLLPVHGSEATIVTRAVARLRVHRHQLRIRAHR